MTVYLTCLACFIAGFLVTWALTPLIIKVAFKVGAVDRPANRKIHGHTTARMGGVGLFFGMWVPLVFLWLNNSGLALQFFENDRHLFLILAGGLAMVIIGFIDDIYTIDSKIKFAAQFPVAILLVFGGARFDSINFPFLGHVELGAIGPFVSVLWLVGITNAVNLIDGVDGLASGVAYLVTLAIATISMYSGQVFMAVVMCCIAGACLGFLQYNFSPAKIFLGDSGSMFLGMTLAVSSTMCSYKEKLGTSLIVPAILMGYPIADTMLSMLRRYVSGKPIFTGDASHIHHRLLRKGLDHRQVCWVIYSVTVAFCLWTFAIEKRQPVLIVLGAVVNVALIILGLYKLGYISFFMSPKVSLERNKFKVAHFFSEMCKTKLVLCHTVSDIEELLRQSVSEFKQSEIKIEFRKTGTEDPQVSDVTAKPDSQTAATQRVDRYFYENTGLEVRAVFPMGNDSEELVTERRMLFGELCKSANQRLLDIAHAAQDEQPSANVARLK